MPKLLGAISHINLSCNLVPSRAPRLCGEGNFRMETGSMGKIWKRRDGLGQVGEGRSCSQQGTASVEAGGLEGPLGKRERPAGMWVGKRGNKAESSQLAH